MRVNGLGQDRGAGGTGRLIVALELLDCLRKVLAHSGLEEFLKSECFFYLIFIVYSYILFFTVTFFLHVLKKLECFEWQKPATIGVSVTSVLYFNH